MLPSDPYVLESGFGTNGTALINASLNAANTPISPQPQTTPGACAWWQTVLFGCGVIPGTTPAPTTTAGPGGLSAGQVYGSGTPVASVFGAGPGGPTQPGGFNVGGMDSSSTGQGVQTPGGNPLIDLAPFEAWVANAGVYLVLGVLLVILGVWLLAK